MGRRKNPPPPQPQPPSLPPSPPSPPPPPPSLPPPPPPSGHTTLSSCIIATVFLTFTTTLILIIFFTFLKPTPPTITLTAVQLPSFSATTTTNATVTFTISHYIAVNNPNHGEFTHYNTNLHLLHAGDQMGFLFVPSGDIAARRTVYIAATFSVKGFPVGDVSPERVNGFRDGSSLEVDLRMEMSGRVRVLKFFTHNVEAQVECKVTVAINGGSVLGFRC